MLSRYLLTPNLPGSVRMKDLTSEHIQALYSHKLTSGLSNRTVRYIYQTLNLALKQAMRGRLIPFNPTKETKPPRKVVACSTCLHFTVYEVGDKCLICSYAGTFGCADMPFAPPELDGQRSMQDAVGAA